MFHVPEHARIMDHPLMGSSICDGRNGAFNLESLSPGWRLMLICSDGGGWEHVSVYAVRGQQSRLPTWNEMCFVKDVCWDDDDVVMQLHPRRSEYVNHHPHVLHLWRPRARKIPCPRAGTSDPFSRPCLNPPSCARS
jgi:hypothetical protein